MNSLHRRSAKLFLSDPSIPTDDKLKTLKLLPLTKQLKYNKAVMMFKVRDGKTPEYIRPLFTRSSSRYDSNNFIPPRPRIDLYQTSLAFSGSSVWNSLSLSLKNLRTIKCFKRHLHRLSSILPLNRANCILSSLADFIISLYHNYHYSICIILTQTINAHFTNIMLSLFFYYY